mgnify:FL=1|tara:strand:+ start:378 stop:860 length:483 start_codon:yes stop_codon:yes gene_type:complete
MKALNKIFWLLICFMILIFIGLQGRNVHYYYEKRLQTYSRAKLYMQTDTCRNNDLRAKLGDYHRCVESEKIVKISPFVLAWYDFLEDWNVCGHKRCERFWNEISGKLPYIVFFMGVVLIWVAWQSMNDRKQREAVTFFQLPTQHPQHLSLRGYPQRWKND